jgi:hypothetical protein
MALGPCGVRHAGKQSHSVGFLGGVSLVLSFAAQKKVQEKRKMYNKNSPNGEGG